jgi:glycosyltransferase involved in cell wall biosynthesis
VLHRRSERRPRVLFLFPAPTAEEQRRVSAGESPSERLYGVHELQQRGWDVSISDERFLGWSAPLIRRLRDFGVNVISPATVRRIWSSDVIVMKDDLSLMVSLVCWLLGRRLIYLDSLFQVPNRWWKRLLSRWSVRLADSMIVYSSTQLSAWSSTLRGGVAKAVVAPYTVDVEFYARHRRQRGSGGSNTVIAVGRDMGRDFPTLVSAVRGTGLQLRLVTLPYLLRDINGELSHVRISEHVSYTELFQLYSESIAAIVPLKPAVVYPSGIRAVLESLILGIPTIVSRVPVMHEYFADGEGPFMVDPSSADALRAQILAIKRDADHARAAQVTRCADIESRFEMSRFVDILEEVLRGPSKKTKLDS